MDNTRDSESGNVLLLQPQPVAEERVAQDALVAGNAMKAAACCCMWAAVAAALAAATAAHMQQQQTVALDCSRAQLRQMSGPELLFN